MATLYMSRTELLAKCSHLSLQLLNAEYILVLHSVKVLARSTVSVASLARAISIASHLGCSAIDTGIDSTAFARSW